MSTIKRKKSFFNKKQIALCVATAISATAVGAMLAPQQALATNVTSGAGATAAGTLGVAIGDNTKTAGSQSVAIGGGNNAGQGAQATGDQSISIGGNTKASGDSGIAIGGDDINLALQKVITGTTTTVSQKMFTLTGESITTGTHIDTTASGAASIAFGQLTVADGDLAIAFGTKAKASGTAAMALGTGSTATLENSVAIGAGSKTNVNATKESSAVINGVSFVNFGGANTEPGDQVSFGSAGYERQLKHVSAGQISATSTDAVNGSQLFSLTQKILNDSGLSTTGEVVPGTGVTREMALSTNNPHNQTITKNANITAAIYNLNKYGPRFIHVNETGTISLANDGADAKDSRAIGLESIAIGTLTTAKSNKTIAIGTGALADGTGAIVIGDSAKTIPGTAGNTGHSIAIGTNAIAVNKGNAGAEPSIAIGKDAKAGGALGVYEGGAVAIGLAAAAGSNNSIAIGSASKVWNQNSLSIGTNSNAYGERAVVLGMFARTGGWNDATTATPTDWTDDTPAGGAHANEATALGFKAWAEKQASIALGVESRTTGAGTNSIAIGYQTETSGINSTAIGNKAKSSGDTALALGGEALATGKFGLSVGYNNKAIGEKSIAIGTGNVVTGAKSGAFGDPTHVGGAGSYAFGNDNIIGSTTNNAFILGNNVKLGATSATYDAATNTTTFAGETDVSEAVAIGNNTGVDNKGGVALGSSSKSTVDKGVVGLNALTNATATATNSTWKSTHAAVSIGDGTTVTRQITGLQQVRTILMLST